MFLTTVLSSALIGQVVLPGSNVGLEEAQAKARFIVVAKPVKTHDIIGAGAISFSDLDLRHSAILKGKVKEEVMERAAVAASGHEIIPEEDVEYIFFINDYANHLNIIKALPKTEKNVAAVKDEIKAKQKP